MNNLLEGEEKDPPQHGGVYLRTVAHELSLSEVESAARLSRSGLVIAAEL